MEAATQPPATGARIEPFTLETTRGVLHVPDPAGRSVVLLFYVEAGTPACSAQIAAVDAEAEVLDEMGGLAVAVSTDPAARQTAFADRLGCARVALASDSGALLARRFGVYDQTQARARRAAFVIDGEGVVRLALPWYNPVNSSQFAALFAAVEAAAGGG